MAIGLTYSDIIAITGHRDYGDPAALFRGLDQLRAREYVFGGARGTDTDALNYLAKTQPGVRRTVVVPDRVQHQPAAARRSIGLHADQVIEMRNKGANRYQLRNEYMVRRSTHVRAFYDGRGRGGTYNTIEYARRTGKPLSITDINTRDINEIIERSPEEFKDHLRKLRKHGVRQRAGKNIALIFIDGLDPGVSGEIMALFHELQDQEPIGVV